MKNNKYKKILMVIIIILIPLSILGLSMSIYNILVWQKDNNKTREETKRIDDLIDVYEINDNNKTEIIDTDEKNKNDLYFKFINMKLIDVDLNELKQTNPDTIGWLEMPGTNINYPVVQTSDNDYYLTHTFYKNPANSGWIYMDYRNDPNGNNKNTIIYGHGRLNKTMFGSLTNAVTESWFNNSDNGVIRFTTETETTLWQIFSSYIIPTTNDYIQTNFTNDVEYEAFLEMLKNRSKFDYGITLNASDKIITLSSCANNDDKIVVHAKLIKRTLKLD